MLSVIGIGFPRTGTMSLKLALEQLGYGPCYHMIEVFDRLDDIALWQQALDGEADWHPLYAGFQSTCDAPGCHFWRELIEEFPSAKCILTIRDADSWYASFRDTVFEVISHQDELADERHRAVQDLARDVILDRMLEGRFEDRTRAIELYERHNRAVQEQIDPSRLLILHIEDGWQPLCDFLDTSIPTEPFPHINTRNEFRERFLFEQAH